MIAQALFDLQDKGTTFVRKAHPERMILSSRQYTQSSVYSVPRCTEGIGISNPHHSKGIAVIIKR